MRQAHCRPVGFARRPTNGMRPRGGRAVVAALLAALVAAGPGPTGHAASPQCAAVHAFGAHWSLIDPPTPPAMPTPSGLPSAAANNSLTDLAVVAGTATTLLVTDGI